MDFLELIASWQASFEVWIDTLLNLAGTDPLTAMWFLFASGGWVVFVPMLIFMGKELYMDSIQTKFAGKLKFKLFRISVPHAHEQTVKAVENMFAQLAGAHSSISALEQYIDGAFQASLSIEIASVEGKISFYIRGVDKIRDLIEAAVYAVYPDAEIVEVSEADYVKLVPHAFPDPAYDAWGAELIPVTADPYPLKTYRDFEDMVSGEFKDPLSATFEVLSRLNKGEHFWYQILLTPTDQSGFRSRAKKVINELKGIKEAPKDSIADLIVLGPLRFLGILGSPSAPTKPELDKRMTGLTGGEKFILESVERKASKIGFECKMRFIYIAKREVFSKPRIATSFIGAIKQFNTFNMQAIKPDFKKSGMSSSIIFFKQRRNDERKTKLVRAYRDRAVDIGQPQYFLSAEELATLWHLPILKQTKAPSVTRTDAKKQEAPDYIPFEM